jgi:hypothetical protein
MSVGFMNGKWQTVVGPNQIDYPFEIAAKLVMDCSSLSHDEACELIKTTKTFYEMCKCHSLRISELEQDLKLSENTVRMLQVSD